MFCAKSHKTSAATAVGLAGTLDCEEIKMELSTGSEECSIQCPNCGTVFIKTLEWLANHRSYICECGATIDALKEHTDKEIEMLNEAIDKIKNK